MVGTHAIARWYERPRGRTEAELLTDLASLIAHRGVTDNGIGSSPEHTIELSCPSGTWIAHPAIGGVNNLRMLRIKTFLARKPNVA